MKTNVTILKMVMLILISIGGNSFPQLKEVSLNNNIKSEANFYTKNNILYSDALIIKFNKNVIPLYKGIRFADKNRINSNYGALKQIIVNLENSYGEIIIEKEIPDAVWGDVQRSNKLTGEIVQIHDFSQLFILRFSNPIPIDSVQNIFKSLPEVEFIHQPILISYDDDPNDPSYQSGFQWNLNAVDAAQAWNLSHGSAAIKIGIIDEGIKENHEDIQGKIAGGTGYFTTNEPHGTWVAGVLGANTNNNKGIASLGWGLMLYNYGGPNTVSSNSLVAQRIINATNAGMDIINMSFGTLRFITLEEYSAPNCDGQTRQKWINSINESEVVIPNDYLEIRNAVEDAISMGIICVASSGNASKNRDLDLPNFDDCDPIQIPFHNYPGEYPGVIAVSGTKLVNSIEEFNADWNYGSFIDISAPGKDIYTTDPSGTYSYRSGTSFSSPLVAALAGLIKSINPSFTYQQVTSILESTADKITAPSNHPYVNGYSDALGFGRINAHKALLETLFQTALLNKSTSYYATAYNNNHTLERGYYGKLHEVFHSGGEIFYRRSSDNGTNWEITSRLSLGNGKNTIPSIVAASNFASQDILCAVWQKEIDSRHFDIMYSFSSNSGTTWTTAAIVPGCSNVWISYYQSGDYYGPGPTPVVASYWRLGSEGTPSFLLVYAAENGLHYRTANTYSSGWAIPANDVIPGSGGSSSDLWFPSLGTYNGQSFRVNLIYGDRFSTGNFIYSQLFYEDGAWSTRVGVDNVGSSNRNNSVAVDYAGNTLAAWSGWDGSKYTIRFRQGFYGGTWSSWYKEWSVSGVNSFYPAITYYNKGGSYPYGIDILWQTSANQIHQKKYYGIGDIWTPTDPNTQLLASNGLFPNISHERQNTTVPRQTWTDQSTSPIYSILYNSSYLPKENLLTTGEIRRAAEIGDVKNGSSLRIDIGQPVIKLNNGDIKIIPFKEFDYTAKLNLNLENIFDYLKTETMHLPLNAESITFNVKINSSQIDTLADGSLNDNKSTYFTDINFELLALDGSTRGQLISAGLQSLENSTGLNNFIKTFTINANTLKGKNIFIVPKVNIGGTFKHEDLNFALSNISIEASSEAPKEISSGLPFPKEYFLEQNFPNPFNPSTKIKYAIKEEGFVTLKIYDLLGREISTLVNEEKPAGFYTVSFDASILSSGIYFYTISASNFHQTKKMLLLK